MSRGIPPLVTLLGSGVPNLDLLDSMLADLDSKLEENNQQIDSCLTDLLKQTNHICGGKSFSKPKEAVQYMADHKILERTSCYDTDTQESAKFLKHVLQTLEVNPGCEETVLQQLLSFSEHCGVSLPSRSAVQRDAEGSMVSLNTVTDAGELEVSQLWDRITVHLRKYFIDQLSRLPSHQGSLEIDVAGKKRLEYVQSLCSLFPVGDVWEKYRSLRIQQFGQCFGALFGAGIGEEVDIVGAGESCPELTSMVITMINEDFLLFNSGVLKRAVSTLRALHGMYLDKFADELSMLVDEIQDEMACSVKKGSKSMPQSHSELGLHGSPTFLLKKGAKTKSLDSMSVLSVDQPPEVCFPKPALSHQLLIVIVKVVTCFWQIDRHMDALHSTISWDVGGPSGKKSRSKGSIKGVLKASPSPDLLRRPMSGMSCESAVSDSSTPSVSSSLSSAVSGAYKPPKVVERTQVEDRRRWDWSHMFKKLSSEVSQCVAHTIHQSRRAGLAADQVTFKDGRDLDTVSVPSELVGGRLDYPRVILKSCGEFMGVLDSLFPLAVVGSDPVFLSTRSAFVDTASLGLKDFHVFLTKLSEDVPKKTPVRVLYLALSTAAYMRNHIVHYENVLVGDKSEKKVFPALYKQYVELVEQLTSQISQVHADMLTHSLLFDAESMNWEDSKEFYEDERCAFPVQMWSQHLQALRSDLWSTCPPRMGQQIFSSVLQESLHSLCHSYCRVSPSYRRTNQYRGDILTILLCVSELLYHSCNSVTKYLDVNRSHATHYSIHSQCCHLLAALAIVTSPLEVLYKVFRNGFTGRKNGWSDPDCEPDPAGYHSHWLAWIRPNLLAEGQTHYEDLQTTSAVHIQVKLLTSQPSPHWPMIIQAIVMKDFTLPILILKTAVEALSGGRPPVKGAFTETSKVPAEMSNTQPPPDTWADNPAHSRSDLKALFDCFFYVMLHCAQFQDGIGKVVLAVISRSGDWDILSTVAYPKGSRTPVWLESVYDLMSPFCNRVAFTVIEEVLERQRYTPDIAPITSVMSNLPCGCPIHKRPQLKHNGEKDVMDWCLRELVSQLAGSIELLPFPIYLLFSMLQEAVCHRKIRLAHNSVGLQIIAGCLRHKLGSPAYITGLTGVELSAVTCDTLTSVADSVYNTLTSTSTKSLSGTPRPAGAFKKHNKEWLSLKIDTVVQFLSSEMFEPSEGTMLDGSTQEFADQLFLSSATSILNTLHGQKHLQSIHNLLCNNRVWVDAKLDIRPPVPATGMQVTPKFSPSLAAPASPPYNPLTDHSRIGQFRFNHAALLEFPIDWYALLQCDLGISRVGFKYLLFHRHEMQDGAYIEDSEKKAVAELKRQFDDKPLGTS